jgi:Na+/H+-dicarboxylate symporter
MAGAVLAPLGKFAWLIGQLYLAVVNMAAIPLLVVATLFGLRQALALSRPALRIGTILATALGLVALCAVAGTLAGRLATPGAHLSDAASGKLGQMVLDNVAEARESRIDLYAPSVASGESGRGIASGPVLPAAARPDVGYPLNEIFPENFYRALAQGHMLGILTATILFGLAIAALSRERAATLNNVLEGIYRTLENIIAQANLLIPVLAFGMAAHLTMHAERDTVSAMAGLLLSFGMLSLLLSVGAVLAVSACARKPFLHVLLELKAPLLVGLTSGSATAPIPHTIEAMSARLGFPRGLVELVVPFGSVFVRAGSALYFALAAVFVANLYGLPVNATEMAWIAAASAGAAFLSAGQNGLGTIGYASVVLSVLQLPVEAAVVLLVAVDLICDGPRNVLSLVCTCAVIALVSAGLPSERTAAREARGSERRGGAVVQLLLTRAQLLLAGGCALTAASLIVLMGIGVGAR